MRWIPVTGSDVRLESLDFGGQGSGVLLLHGLAGTAREWEETAGWLTREHRVVALDQRGHGRSERRPADVSREAFVADAVAAIEELQLAPVVLIGQSLGAHTAFLIAAHRPELVGALVAAEASPGSTPAEEVERVRALIAGWPVPFSSRQEAEEFFGGDTLRARAWARNLEGALDGLRPAFDVDVMGAALAATGEDSWREWRSIRAPTLVVRGEGGELSLEAAEAMAAQLPSAEIASLPGAGHDVHLDAPEAWRAAVEGFLARLS